ncbi:MAG: molybdopterin-dependent oxidoreductase [Chloroflexi bacterium]|nr:molybdopterin-dependent oxidoreductase [Chloroflexota bacterium]MCI0823376.1 molybdopterin-dependent oxidoreductase [Chloroflexota bacterium]MCI0858286.1 molybdopterin-dependent oxidoreductase [Chloroflexota bacterium]MCI0877778.1 molybdopterin-dependent oxidoreductase [Chloroflexota bacterium]MCI0893650.1 molybdopterin-dependent oxidoreductase [Chloroflexota bacterium]
MNLTRRNFLAWAGLSAVGAVACEGFGIREGEFSLQSPVALPEDLVRGKDNWYATLCRQCPSSEGIVVRVMEGRAKKIQGNPVYPTNMGKQSARCEAGLQAMYHPDRIAGPMRRAGSRGSGQFEPLDWRPALDTLKFQLQNRGGSMLMITEPLRGNMATLVDRFTQAAGGTHMGFETLDNNTYREALKNVYRQDLLPDFDLEHTSFLLSFGADFLSTWVSPTRWNRGYGEFRQGEGRRRGTFYHVDPRFSMTAANADKWLPIKPGWEGHLALSLAYVIISEGRQAPGVDVGGLTNGQGAAALEAYRPEAVAERIGFTEDVVGANPVEVIRQLARDFAANLPSLAIGGGSSGAHTNGLFNLEAIYALNYLVGSVGTPGGVIFNPDSPIPEILPAAARVASLADWTAAADDLRNGRTELVLLHGADPVHGLPGSLGLGDALDRSDIYIVSFSPFLDETSVMADLILPDRVYLEDWGSDVPEPGPGYQTVGMQQPVINPLSDLNPRSFPDVLLAMADELGKRDELPWDRYQDFLRESSDRLFELNRGSIQAASADEFWTTMMQQGGWWDNKALAPSAEGPAGLPAGLYNDIVAKAAEPSFPGVGLSGDSFYLVPFSHNSLLDGQNAHLPWLQAAPDPLTTIAWQTWVEMNDHDAQVMGLREGDVVQVESSRGSILALVYLTPAVPPKVVCIPLGQGHRSGPDAASGRPGNESANVMSILEPSLVDGTGSLAWANTRVTITPTGNSVKVSKFEGIVRAVEVGNTPGERIIRTIGVEDL